MEVVSSDVSATAGQNEEGWDTDPHPFRRYAARIIDVQLFSGIGGFVLALIGFITFPEVFDALLMTESRMMDLLVWTPLSWIMTAPIIALLLSKVGTTPGKFLLGLRVRTGDGSPLTFRRAARREGILLLWGIGFGIPLFSMIAAASSYSTVSDGRPTRWDDQTDLYVTARQAKGLQLVGLILGGVLVIAFLAWTVASSAMAA